jgi:hypothetical protein
MTDDTSSVNDSTAQALQADTGSDLTGHPTDTRPTGEIITDLNNQVAAVTSGYMSTDQLAAAARPLAELADTATARLATAAQPLSVGDATTIGMILHAAQTGQHVARLTPSGDVLVGIARHVVTSDTTAAFPHPTDDVRNCYLRVTSTSGFGEYFWPMTELIAEHQDQTFVTGYEP